MKLISIGFLVLVTCVVISYCEQEVVAQSSNVDDDVTDVTESSLNTEWERRRGRHGHGRHHGGHHGSHGGRHRHHRHHGDGDESTNLDGRRSNWRQYWNMTSAQKLEHFCRKIESGESTDNRQDGHMRRKMQNMTEEQRQQLRTSWQRKIREMTACCGIPAVESERRGECADKVKSDRIDRICRKEEPVCPFAMSGRGEGEGSFTQTFDRCCAMEGTPRYGCFMEAKQTMKRNDRRRKFYRKKKY